MCSLIRFSKRGQNNEFFVKNGASTLLRIDADLQVQGSNCRYLADCFLETYLRILPQTEVFLRDLAISPLLDDESEAMEKENIDIPKSERISDVLCEELALSRRLLITTNLENMSVPNTLKRYIDQVVKKYRNYCKKSGNISCFENGKKLLVITCSDGIYSHGRDKKNDFLSPYLTAVFSMVGVKDIRFVTAAGLNVGSDEKEYSICNAKAELAELASEWK